MRAIRILMQKYNLKIVMILNVEVVGICCVVLRRGKFENNTILCGKFILKSDDKLRSELRISFCDGDHGTN